MKNRSASYSFLMPWRLGIWRDQQMREFRRARGCPGITAKIIALSWCYFWHKLQWNWDSIPGYHGPNWLLQLDIYRNISICKGAKNSLTLNTSVLICTWSLVPRGIIFTVLCVPAFERLLQPMKLCLFYLVHREQEDRGAQEGEAFAQRSKRKPKASLFYQSLG